MADLKPCPFCGGKAEVRHRYKMMWGSSYICCTKCGVQTEEYPISHMESSDSKAIEAWNRRVEDGTTKD